MSQVQIARAIAAFVIVLGHTLSEAAKLATGDGLVFGWLATLPFGIGVDIFFVISGFIMVYISASRMDDPDFATKFLVDRVARIVPNYWFYTILICIALFAAPSAFDTVTLDMARIVNSFLFFPGFGESELPVLILGWSLNYEMFFYAVFAIGIWLAGRSAVRWTVLALGAFCAIYYAVPLASPFSYWFAPVILEFAFGMVIAEVFLRNVRIGAGVAWGLIALAIALGVVLRPLAEADVIFLVQGLPSAIIVFAIVSVRQWASFDSPVLKAGEVIGDASYTLYLAHPFVLTVIYLVWSRLGAEGPWAVWSFVLVASAASVIYSVLAYRFIEKPLTRLTRMLAPMTRPRRAAPSGER